MWPETHEYYEWGMALAILCCLVLMCLVIVGSGHGWLKGMFQPSRYCSYNTKHGSSCTIRVIVYNDTNETYVVGACTQKFNLPECESIEGNKVTLSPGQSIEATGTTSDIHHSPWVAFDQHGKRIGCLNLLFPQNEASPAEAQLSAFGSCKEYL